MWDVRTGEVLQRLSGHTNVVSWVVSSPVEPALMTCSNDHRARFWFDDSQ
jgi:cleavage stimulation factor subunit 1